MNRFTLSAMGVAVVATTVLAGCSAPAVDTALVDTAVPLPVVTTQEVTPGGMQTFFVLGEVQADQVADLTAEFRSDVTGVSVQPGDRVRAGQTLVTLSSSSLNATLNNSRTSLALAQQTLDETLAANEKSIESAEVSLTQAETALRNTLTENNLRRDQAEESLTNTLTSLDLSIDSAESTLDSAIRTARTTVVTGINEADQILGVSPLYDDLNESFEDQLGSMDLETMRAAMKALDLALPLRDTTSTDFDVIRAASVEVEDMLVLTLATLNASTTSANLSQATLTGYIDTISSQLTSIRSQLASLDSAYAALASASNTSGDGAESQTAVNARADYAATLATLDTAEDSARQAVDAARVALESAKRQAALSETSARSGVTGAETSFDSAAINAGKLRITAPFAGVVSDVPVKVGDEVLPNEPLVRIEDPTNLKIVAYLTRNQMQQVAVGDDVQIGTSSADVIAARSTTIDPSTRKFKIEIEHRNEFLAPGQFIDLTFTGAATTNSDITLPLPAVMVTGDGDFVWLVGDDSVARPQSVELGEIRGSQVVIASGLAAEDVVVVSDGRMLSGEEVAVQVAGGIAQSAVDASPDVQASESLIAE